MRIPSLVLTGFILTGLVLFAACEAKTPPDAGKPAGAQAGNQPANPPANVGKAPAADDGILPLAKPVQTPGAIGPEQGPPRPMNPDMDAGIKELMVRREIVTGAQKATYQHVLIAFKGAEKATVTRSKDEAKALAQKIYADAAGGADFKRLMKQSDDPGDGEYEIDHTTNFVQGFKDVAFRLGVGEIGVSPYDTKASYFGWHIIKRVK